MNEGVHSFQYGQSNIDFRLLKRARKTLEISVYPDMSVEVVAPFSTDEEKILKKLKKRASWINKQIKFFEQFHPRRSNRYYISGETHLYLGRQYKLQIIHHLQKGVKLARGKLIVQTHYPTKRALTRELLENWYSERASLKFQERVEACLKYFSSEEGLRPNKVVIRQMEKRWGSMTPSRKLILNRNLIKAPIESIDYVIVHELCHIRHPYHSSDFYRYLTQVLPDWEQRKMKLERMVTG